MADKKFEEVDVLRDDAETGVVAVLTRNMTNGAVSFMLAKEFERDGVLTRTSFLIPRHLDAVRRLLNKVETWMADQHRIPLRR